MEYVLMGNGKKNAKVMFIADFPSFEEYDNDKWFSDRPGKLLRSVLKEVGIEVKDCYFTGIVKKPTQEDAKGNQLEPGKAEVEEHMDIFLAELEVVNPKIIVPMGNVALKKTLGNTGITKFRGKGVEKDGKIIFPIVHPRLVFRQPKHAENFTRDVQNLADLVREGEKLLEQTDVNYRYLETYEEVEAEIERLNKEAEWLVFDLETTGLNPFRKGSKIVSISLTDKDHYGVSIPLEHRDFTWQKETLDKIIELLRNLFANKRTKKVAHNGKFDMKWLKAIYGIDVENFAFDPMLAHYITVSEERGGHGLKELAWEHTDMGGYDNALDEYKKKHLPASERGNYDLIPWKILREYAAADVDCTFRLIKIFKPMIDANPKWKKMYDELFIEGSYALMDMECNGILATKERVEEFQRAYEERIAEIEERLREFPEIVQIEREKQKLFELRQKEMKKPKEERDPEILKYNKYKNFKFNFSSVVQLRELLFEKLGLNTPYLTDTAQKKGVKLEYATLNDFSTGKETLEYLKDKHPIASLLAEWKRLDKLYGTYIAPASDWIDTTDGRVHGTFNLTGTVTSRLASEAPNMQNIPRKSNDPTSFEYKYGPKKLFTSRFGEDGVILQFDYCLAGETLIRTAFQGNLTIKEIVERVNKGENIYVYSCDPETNEIIVSKVEKGMLTFKNKEVFKVYLDNGEVVRATAEHPFMLRSGEYRQVKDLKPNDSLMSFREYTITDPKSGVQYRSIGVDYQNRRLEHRIISDYFNGETPDLIVHHKDGNGLNNNPENLEPMTQAEHWRLHQKERWNKMSDEERSEFINSQDRWSEETKKKLSENAKNMWASFTEEEYNDICRKLSESANNKGENNPMYGKQHSYSTRELLSERQRAFQKTKTPEERLAASVKMKRAKIKKIADAIKADGEKINHKNWEEYRKKISPRAPRWETAYEDLVIMEAIENHKVVAVIPDGSEEVYDIKVENHANFALASGIFVHNSQLELRVAAIFSNDEGLKSAYREGKDLHKFVASRVYGVPEEEVSADQRTAAKAVKMLKVV